MPSAPSLFKFIITTTSLELVGRPSGKRATCGMLTIIPAANQSRTLMISLMAALRTTITLSSDPVDRRVFCTPLAIINTAAKTKTTSAMPNIVIAVVNRREIELRSMYLRGICTRSLPYVSKSFDDARRQHSPQRDIRCDQTDGKTSDAADHNSFRFDVENRKPPFRQRGLKSLDGGNRHCQTHHPA